MNRQKEYITVERKRIIRLISNIDDLWILGRIYKFIVNMTKEEGV